MKLITHMHLYLHNLPFSGWSLASNLRTLEERALVGSSVSSWQPDVWDSGPRPVWKNMRFGFWPVSWRRWSEKPKGKIIWWNQFLYQAKRLAYCIVYWCCWQSYRLFWFARALGKSQKLACQVRTLKQKGWPIKESPGSRDRALDISSNHCMLHGFHHSFFQFRKTEKGFDYIIEGHRQRFHCCSFLYCHKSWWGRVLINREVFIQEYKLNISIDWTPC